MYPIDLEAEYGDGVRSRGLAALGIFPPFKAIALLPHFVILWALGLVLFPIAWVGYVAIAFTGKLPEFFYTFPVRVLGWQARTTGWMLSITDAYPPFEWDPPRYGVRFVSTEGAGPRNRLFAVMGIFFLKAIAVIPHMIVLAFIMLFAVVSAWLAFVVIIVTGTYPQGLFAFIVGAVRWELRVASWLWSLTDEYPPFRLT